MENIEVAVLFFGNESKGVFYFSVFSNRKD